MAADLRRIYSVKVLTNVLQMHIYDKNKKGELHTLQHTIGLCKVELFSLIGVGLFTK